MTAVEHDGEERQRIRTFLTNVVDIVDIHPHLRQITFGGGDLATFEPLGPDTFLYVLVPPKDRSELTIGRDFSWDTVSAMPAAERPGGAYYTLRRWDAATRQLTIHVVLHGDSGTGSAWAQRVAVGNPVALWGPRTAFTPPDNTDWLLLVADETGLPATAAILEQLPTGQRAVVFAEVNDETEQQELPESPAIEVTWLHRHGAPPGTTTLLVDAVRLLRPPNGHAYAWGGGERRAVTAVRQYLRHDLGLPSSSVSMTGYWRLSADED